MGYIRGLKLKPVKTFGELCEQFISMVSNIHLRPTRIDFVFDSYLEGAIKDSERERAMSCINLNYINFTTPLPVDLDPFGYLTAINVNCRSYQNG